MRRTPTVAPFLTASQTTPHRHRQASGTSSTHPARRCSGRLTGLVAVLLAFIAAPTPALADTPGTDVVAYVGGTGNQHLQSVLALSDGTYLVGGAADDLSWLGADVRRIALGGPRPQSGDTGMTPFLMHVASDLSRVLAVATLPIGCAQSIDVIRTTSVPGQATGAIYISGRRTADKPNDVPGGYFIARLDGNFVQQAPTALAWVEDVKASGNLAQIQPWDVGGDGKVVFAAGEPYGYSWMAVYRIDAQGDDDVVPEWRTHWYVKDDGEKGEHQGSASTAPGRVVQSGIVLKIWNRGDFRSWTRADFVLQSSDGNGGVKQGRWPLDAMFPGYYDPATRKTVDVTGTKKGYYGYRYGGTPCAAVLAIAIDRRSNEIYIGGNNKSRLPDGNPDFEPWIVAMAPNGALRWWQRLYPESKGVSTPDQYVDAIAIDYTQPLDAGGSILVGARSHGNNVNNFWQGNAIQRKGAPSSGFQNQFTGTSGNIHYSWLGRMTAAEGQMQAATYLAEYAEGAKAGPDAFREPLLSNWPRFDSGWPDVNTTRIQPHSLAVDHAGNVHVLALGRRVITTRNAFQQMPDLMAQRSKRGVWSDFTRTYTPDLRTLRYSSILTGTWDWETGKGSSKVELLAAATVRGGVLIVGTAPVNRKTGQVEGNPMPISHAPAWATKSRSGDMGVIAFLPFQQQ